MGDPTAVDANTELKEFLYVDVDRVRSLLAQIQGGFIEAITSESTNEFEAAAEARIFGIGGRGGYTRGARTEESRSTQDVTFVVFERLANEEGLITELDASFCNPAAWATGEPHTKLREGQLIRIECDLQVLDAGLVGERLNRFDQLATALVGFSSDALPIPKNATQKQKTELSKAAKTAIMGGADPEMLRSIGEFISAFVGDSISVRLLPCGLEHLEYGFSGPLLGRREYIQEERENLFSRYGSRPSKWTAVAQIAGIPSQDEDEFNPSEMSALRPGTDIISRAATERLAAGMLAYMESIGLVEGPRWPSVSITPLGIYRNVPRTS